MTAATRAAALTIARSLLETSSNPVFIARTDAQALGKAFLDLYQEKIVFPVNETPIGDAKLRDRALELACTLRLPNTDFDDVICAAYVMRAFLMGSHDRELVDRTTDSYVDSADKYTDLHRLVFGPKPE